MTPDAASANPFAEPGQDDRTVVVPRSEKGRAAAPSAAPAPPGSGEDPLASFKSLPAVGTSPIVAAAAPLLSLLSGLHSLAAVPDPESLRARTVAEVRRYEQQLRGANVPLDLIRTSHYAICASLDDVIQNTPWGSRGAWADASLVSTFHQEVRSGERFFDLLTRLCQSPGKFLPTIELMYLCMSLGMQGRYRVAARGASELDRVREEVYLVILRQRGAAEPALSPHWQGVSAPYRRFRAEFPVWLAALIALALLCLAYVLLLLNLNTASDRLFASALALPPAAMPTIARDGRPQPLVQGARPGGARERIAAALAPEIKSGAVALVGTEAVPIIRLRSAGMFASGSATLEKRFLPVLDRLAAALGDGAGPVRVVGYTDDVPIHTVAFPSNFQLSLARARAAAAVLAAKDGSASVSAEGRADADPIDTNATPAGRAENRRIEVVVGGGT